MDYGFSPGAARRNGSVTWEATARQMFQRRSNTTLVTGRRIPRVRQFITHLDTSGAVTRPVEDILIGSHANAEGEMQIQLFNGQRGGTNFETLEAAIANAGQSIAILDSTIGHTAGDAIAHEFAIKGCNVGKAGPFLAKFQEALGGNVRVSAPLHFHGITPEPNIGTFEWMAYEFRLLRTTGFANRAAAVTAFENLTTATLFDGTTAVPTAWWGTRQAPLTPAGAAPFAWQEPWIPRRIPGGARGPRRPDVVNRDVRAPITPAVGTRNTVGVVQQFRAERRRTGPWWRDFATEAAVPNGAAERRDVIRDLIASRPNFRPSHEFPVYERWGFSDVDDFFNALNWNIRRNGLRLTGVGTAFGYTIVAPIVDLQTGNLLHNFYPAAGSPHDERNTALRTNDSQFFGKV